MTGTARRVPLASIADIQLGKMLSPKSKSGREAYPYLRNQNIQWDRIDLTEMAEMDFNAEERRKFALVPGDLLVCEGGEPGRAAMWRGELGECFYQKALHRIRPHHGVNAEYLMFALWRMSSTLTFSDANSKTTIAHLPLARLSALTVPVIDYAGQVALVTALRQRLGHAQSAIAASSGQVTVANAKVQAAILAEAFRHRPPIGVAHEHAVPSGWKNLPLGTVGQLFSGHTPSRRRPEWWGGHVPWLALPDIRKLHGRLAHETIENINDAGLANSSARMLPAGTICVSRTASIGFVTMLGRPMATSQDFCNWVCDPERLDPEFLMYAFMASQDSLRELGSGAVHKTIYMPTIKSFQIFAPGIDEQRRTARMLRDRLAAAEVLTARLRERNDEIQRLPQRLLVAAFDQIA